jgi:hypothetical protein
MAPNGAKVQKVQTASNASETKKQRRQLHNNGIDASTIKNGHRFHDNANDSTQTYAFKWTSTVQGSENLLEGDLSPDSQRPVHKGAPPVCGSRTRQHLGIESGNEIWSMDAGEHAPEEFNLSD